jgi:uncharacterized membrane protein
MSTLKMVLGVIVIILGLFFLLHSYGVIGNCSVNPQQGAVTGSVFGGNAGQVCSRAQFGLVLGVILLIVGIAIIFIGNRGKKSSK